MGARTDEWHLTHGDILGMNYWERDHAHQHRQGNQDLEFRVGLTPEGVRELAAQGHSVMVESGAGAGIGLADAAFEEAGGRVVANAAAVFENSDLIVKVKEPQPAEIAMLRPDHTLFTYLHLAADPQQTRGLMKSGATCIAYETITDDRGGLPLLAPMSQVAGRMATMVGAQFLL